MRVFLLQNHIDATYKIGTTRRSYNRLESLNSFGDISQGHPRQTASWGRWLDEDNETRASIYD